MYSNSTFLTPSTSNSCLCVFNNRLPRLARCLQAVFIVTNSFGRLNKLETWNLNLKLVSYSLRGNYASFLPSTKSTTYGLHSFLYMASKLWNSLPILLERLTSLISSAWSYSMTLFILKFYNVIILQSYI